MTSTVAGHGREAYAGSRHPGSGVAPAAMYGRIPSHNGTVQFSWMLRARLKAVNTRSGTADSVNSSRNVRRSIEPFASGRIALRERTMANAVTRPTGVRSSTQEPNRSGKSKSKLPRSRSIPWYLNDTQSWRAFQTTTGTNSTAATKAA